MPANSSGALFQPLGLLPAGGPGSEGSNDGGEVVVQVVDGDLRRIDVEVVVDCGEEVAGAAGEGAREKGVIGATVGCESKAAG